MQVLRFLPNKEKIKLELTTSLGQGGEACVYTVPNEPRLVAKVYHNPSDTHARKLQAMLAHPPDNPTAQLGHISIAWPVEILHAAEGSDRVVGFLMPRLSGMRPLIDFYHPRTRRQHCPLFNYQYLIRTARNLAAAFAALHAKGYVVGDVNESNILVSDTALVTLVDTDSFQVPDTRKPNVVYRCEVGKPEFTPPELQNKVFANYDRRIEHDLFGLGVLIFQLLMEGTHPFSGIYQGSGEPPPYEARIASGHFTYSQNKRVPYTPTPISPSWDMLHPGLRTLFLRCFEQGHEKPSDRPSAHAWLLVLSEAENQLVSCSANPQHRYHKHQHTCPWCDRTLRLGGRDPFPSPKAVEAKVHLQPHKSRTQFQGRQRYPQDRRKNQQTLVPTLLQPPQTLLQFPHRYKRSRRNRGIVYPIVMCLLGFGVLGYVELLSRLSQQDFAQQPPPYTQQTFLGRKHAENLGSFDDYYKKAHAEYQVKNYEQALQMFSLALEKNPNHSTAYVNRANTRYNLKDYEGALGDYSEALRINPNEVKAYVNRGNVHLILAEYSSDPDREYNSAIADYDKALGFSPGEAEAYIRRGIARAQVAKYSGDSQRDYKRAIEDFDRALGINPAKTEALFQRGVVRYQIAQYSSEFDKEYKRAIEDFNQALRQNTRLAKAYLKRGLVRYELAQYQGGNSSTYHAQAVDDLRTAAKISLEQDDMDNYHQAVNSICVVVENKCDSILQNSN